MLDNAKKELEKAGDALKSKPPNKIESKESTSVARDLSLSGAWKSGHEVCICKS
jgi:hypothetical protein